MPNVYPQPHQRNHFPNAPNITEPSLGLTTDISEFSTHHNEVIDGVVGDEGAIYLCTIKEPAQPPADEDLHGQNEGIVRKLRADNGGLVWEFHSESQLMGPTLAGDTLYVSQHHSNQLIAIDTTSGDVEWVFDAGRSHGLFWPIVAGDTVFVSKIEERLILPGFTGSVYAIDASTGNEKWEANRQVPYTLTVDDTLVYGVSSKNNEIVGMNRNSGVSQWSFELAENPPKGGLISSDNDLYVGGLGELISIDKSTQSVNWRGDIGDRKSGMPSVANKSVFVGTIDNDGKNGLYAFHRGTGERRWKASLDGYVGSQPMVAKNTVYVTTSESQFYSIDRESGAVNFSVELEGSDNAWLQPTPSGERIYAAGNGSLFTFEHETGSDKTEIYNTPKLTYSQTAQESGPSYCPDCGSSLESHVNPAYCPNCGSSLQ